MGSEAIRTIAAVIASFVGLAILSVIVSKNANTGSIIQDLSSGVGNDIQAATSPVTSSGIGTTTPYAYAQTSSFGAF